MDSLTVENVEPKEEFSPLTKIFRYAIMKPLNIIDFCCIAPYYLTLLSGSKVSSVVILRVLRLSQVIRVFKVKTIQIIFTLLNSSVKKALPALRV